MKHHFKTVVVHAVLLSGMFGLGNSIHGPQILLLFIITRDGAVCGGMKRVYIILGMKTNKKGVIYFNVKS